MQLLWKDYFVNLGTASAYQFRIKVGDDVIYSGRAYKRPGQLNVRIRINDICADYLQYALPRIAADEFTNVTIPTFVVQILSGTTWTQKASVQFLYDWSFDPDYDPETMGVAAPINGRIDLRQWLIYSVVEADEITAYVHKKDGTVVTVTVPVTIPGDFSDDFNYDFSRIIHSTGTGTVVFDLSDYGDVDHVIIDNWRYQVVGDCYEYALYYVNAYGGWDALLIEGSNKVVDNITRHTRDVEYDNTSGSARGRQDYVNEIEKTYSLVTGWLSDEESAKMHHLMNSPLVYLGEIGTGHMLPIVLTNSQTEYKTYKNNGAKLVNYTIEATLAQDRIRR